MIWRSVRSDAMCSALTSGRFGWRCWMAEKISTRLIESIPSPASSSMSRLSTSTG